LDWLKTIDDNLRKQPNTFGKNISKFKWNDQSATQIKVGDKFITDLECNAAVFA
jgi:hypothetical protein